METGAAVQNINNEKSGSLARLGIFRLLNDSLALFLLNLLYR